MRGKYVGKDKSSNLVLGQSYYLFENGQGYFYVSNFNNKNAHFGCFQKSLFELFEETSQEGELILKEDNSGQISFF